MFVIASTCAAADPVAAVVVPSVDPVLTPSELVEGRSEAMSGVRDEVLESVPSPIAEAIRESGDSAEVVGSVPSAEDRASLKLVDPVPVVAPSDAPPESAEV